jgi:tyrosine-specific transport protein
MNTKLIGGTLLVAGTAIGAGMLALPVLTGMAGFYPSLLMFVAVWLGTVFTALLILEVNLWYQGEINLITMASKTLGKGWAAMTWVMFLLLLYSLTAAYLAGSGKILSDATKAIFDSSLPRWFEPLPFFVFFGAFIYFGIKPVDYLNRLMMFGLGITYFILIAMVFPNIDAKLLKYSSPAFVWVALPVIVTSFGFHVVIPSLTSYLDRDVKSLRKAIFIGSAVPLIIYIVWEWVILGALPVDENGWFTKALAEGEPATHPLAILLKNSWISTFARFFSFFAIVTSFLGITLSLSNFLADGLKVKKTQKGRLGVTLLTFGPPLLFVLIYPRGFIMALQYAGVFVALISGILPALMAWKGRYVLKKRAHYQVKGGKLSLILAILCSIAIILLQISLEFGWLKSY